MGKRRGLLVLEISVVCIVCLLSVCVSVCACVCVERDVG